MESYDLENSAKSKSFHNKNRLLDFYIASMLNFTYDIPTKVFFGKGQISHLTEQIKRFGDRVLVTYGSWSIKEIWLYDQVIELLKKENIHYRELWNIQPNPDISSVREGIRLCKENNIQLLLAVWWGSVIDATKGIALGYFYDGDPRDVFSKETNITQALPIGTILTLAATWSEMDSWMVISNRELDEKRDYVSDILFPQFSILDPTYTFTVPPKHTVAGIVDIMSHIFEQYFSLTESTETQDNIAEGLLHTCIYHGHKVLANPEDYDARANLMRTSSLALNGLIGLGKAQDRSSHYIEHSLSAVYDITHGDWLAIVFPNWMEYVLWDGSNEKILDKFLDFATRVRGIPEIGEPLAIAHQGIQATRKFRSQLWAPAKLSDVDIIGPDLEELADKVIIHGSVWSFMPLEKKDVMAILEKCI